MNPDPIIDLHPMNWNQAIDHNPALCFCVIAGACFISWTISSACYQTVVMVARNGIRAIKVVCRGWPPAHLDADGEACPLARPPDPSGCFCAAKPILLVPRDTVGDARGDWSDSGWVIFETDSVDKPTPLKPENKPAKP